MSRRLVRVMALAIAGAVLGGCATPSQMIADHKMDEYCKKEGVFVNEYISEPVSNWYQGFTFALGTHPLGKHSQYRLVNSENLVYGSSTGAHITEYKQEIFRVSDSKLMGYLVKYSRSGGEFILSPAERIGHICNKQPLVSLVGALSQAHLKGVNNDD